MSSTRHKPIIAVSVTGTEAGQDNQVLLGYVHPPTVNNISVHSLYDDSDKGIHKVLDALWSEWREAVAAPDSDSQFIDWLVEEKGWKIAPMTIIEHIIS